MTTVQERQHKNLINFANYSEKVFDGGSADNISIIDTIAALTI